jgi:hypothetical protein
MEYFEKITKKPKEDLSWNVPEQKRGIVNIIGGNDGNFNNEIKIAEFLGREYPIEDVKVVLPDSLKNKLPPLPNFIFMPATETGSFTESQELYDVFDAVDYNLVLGDLSRNAITGKALAQACRKTERMTLITKDAVELLAEHEVERWLMNENLVLMASMPQLQKLLRAIYYPKMLLLSQSLVQVVEVLHKFTLSYPVALVTLHNEQILLAENGIVKAIPLEKSDYSPIMIWNGELAAKIVGMNLYNPNQFIGASCAAIFG